MTFDGVPGQGEDSRGLAVSEPLEEALGGFPLSDITPHVLRHSFASIANDLGFTEVTIAGALVGHAKGSVTSKYIHTLDTALIMAADTISGYVQGFLDGIEFKQTAYALDRGSRKAALARFLKRASTGELERKRSIAWPPRACRIAVATPRLILRGAIEKAISERHGVDEPRA